VAAVREEVAAKRLNWSREEVESLIKPYPNHKEVDAVLEKQEDDTWLDAMEKPYQEEESDKESVHSGSDDAHDEDEKKNNVLDGKKGDFDVDEKKTGRWVRC
jgi:hypothetical protein